MIYKTHTDYLIDNRNGIAKELREITKDLPKEKAEEIIEACLGAYDFAALDAVTEHAYREITKDTFIDLYSGNEWYMFDIGGCSNHFDRIEDARGEYITAAKDGEKVGYSALEEGEGSMN